VLIRLSLSGISLFLNPVPDREVAVRTCLGCFVKVNILQNVPHLGGLAQKSSEGV
jgi:hypothetical protein